MRIGIALVQIVGVVLGDGFYTIFFGKAQQNLIDVFFLFQTVTDKFHIKVFAGTALATIERLFSACSSPTLRIKLGISLLTLPVRVINPLL